MAHLNRQIRIRDPNVIIGVVPSDTPVDFVNLMWSSQCELNVRSYNTGELSGKWAYIKCPGNMTAHGWQVGRENTAFHVLPHTPHATAAPSDSHVMPS